MGFETNVLAKVAEVLHCTNAASFDHGTMFVSGIFQEDAERVLCRLYADLKCSIEMNKVGADFAFDFV
jgi:ribosomal protein L11 methylase PrmA